MRYFCVQNLLERNNIMDRFSFLNAVHSEYIGDLYDQYLQYPDSIEPSWKAFFQGYDFGKTTYNGEEINTSTSVESNTVAIQIPEEVEKEFKVINLINAYRLRGHLFTRTNPVRDRRKYTPTLELSNFGLSESDLNTTFKAGEILGVGGPTSLKNIVDHLQSMYCESIGIEYMYIRKPEKIKWIQSWLNQNLNHPVLSKEQKERIFSKLNEAVAFESFLHTKFVGQKRFSLEGNESLIPALDALINRASENGVKEFVVGMAHRGRLNVLANIFNKSYSQIFSEFESKDFEDELFSGDVKYHLGSTTQIKSRTGQDIKINLAPNPSHLETVDPVVEGITRAKIDADYNGDYSKVLPILIHGDAAIAGQGVVYEVIQMMTLDGYKTGGTIHIVVNNQIGFTTNYLDARSSLYCTDVAKVNLSPVLHVNADDAEAVIHSMKFAADYRQQFGENVFIDLLGYRKYGHNEGDEPRFTQPKLYEAIAKHPNPREIYKEKLLKEGVIGEKIVKEKEKEFKDLLEKNFDTSKNIEKNALDPFMPEEWEGFKIAGEKEVLQEVNTKFPVKELEKIKDALTTLPEGKKPIRKVIRLLEQRKKMVEENKIDWGMAELMAYATVLVEGQNVRLSGEDVERGTFSHRHAVIKTEDSEERIVLLNQIQEKQGVFSVYNSPLSEYGVLGFDYGYAMATPKGLIIWEAQFGDFVNGGQIVIDQYISAAEDKWKIQNGLVMLLPHGYEGQGAEHSSARVERFLQSCAENNMYVTNCTTPANFFHLIRRQTKTNFRKPLIIFTPKSLLRHPVAVSTVDELANGTFQEVVDDVTADPKKINKLVFCSGKFYYDLLSKKEALKDDKTALIRLEQLYPLNEAKIDAIIKKYAKHKELIWAQEEPENMGAWSFILRKLRRLPFEVVSPAESSATAPGSHRRFEVTQNDTINRVFEQK